MQDNIHQIMLTAFHELLNTEFNIDEIQIDDNFVLFGEGSLFDSILLVNLIVELEMRISEFINSEISLTDDRAMTREISPFDTFGSLKTYIEELINEI